MNPSKIEFARLVCLNGALNSQPSPGENLAYDTSSGLFTASIEVSLAKIVEMESQLGLPSDPALTPIQRCKRLEAEIEKRQARPLSAQRKPNSSVRWTDSKGKSHVDLAAIFNQEAAAASGGVR